MGEYTDKAKGKAKELEGDLTGDSARKRQGVAQEIKGNLKGVVGKVEDATKKIAEKVKDTFKNDKHK